MFLFNVHFSYSIIKMKPLYAILGIIISLTTINGCMASSDRKAAEQGNASAQDNLGLMYAKGEGVVQNYKESVKWFRKAAEQGDASAQYNLGVTYAKGEGVPQDYVMAHKYFNIAASSGLKSAHKNRDIVAKLMTASQIEKAQNLASEWMKTH